MHAPIPAVADATTLHRHGAFVAAVVQAATPPATQAPAHAPLARHVGTTFGSAVAAQSSRSARLVVAGGRLSPLQLEQLMALSTQYPENQWPISRDIALGRNKHRTNTFGEIRDGLVGPYDWFEGDVRMQGGIPVLAHDFGNHDGLTMAEWLQVGAASGRGLKFDFKEASAIAPVVALVQQAGVPDERLLWNVTILDNGAANASMATLLQLRRLFPLSVINLSIGSGSYDPATIQRAVDIARQVGGPIMFPLDAAHVTPAVVAGFRQGGKVAIWNSPVTYDPTNIPADTAKFRSWGVDGMIDLQSNHFSAAQGDNVNGNVARVPGRH